MVVPTAENEATNIAQSYSCKHAGVEAVVETSNKHVSSFGNEVRKDSTAESDVEDDMKAELRKVEGLQRRPYMLEKGQKSSRTVNVNITRSQMILMLMMM